MPRPQKHPIPLKLPPKIDPDVLPVYGTSAQFQEIASFYRGPVSAATIQDKFNLTWRRFNGRNVAATSEFLAELERRFNAAPILGCDQEPTPPTATAKAT